MPPRRSRIRRALARGCAALASVLAVASTGTGYWVAHGALGGISVSEALGVEDPRSARGEMNILLIGLDSRKDQDGNDLSDAVLDKLHAGDSDSGGYNTNTLILVHVGADDRVVAFSIPRDDYVRFTGVPGYTHIKIKEAYGLTRQHTANRLAGQGVTSQKELESRSREAGRAGQPAAGLAAGHVRITLGLDYHPDYSLPPLADETTPTPTRAGYYASTTSTEPTPDAGKPIDGSDGGSVPCVN